MDGQSYKIPRIKVKDCSDRDDLTNTGIYLLFGKDDEGRHLVYIGEAESVLKRLYQHLNLKDFWHEAIIFINSKDKTLNKAQIKFLENRLHAIASTAGRYKVDNSVTPTQSSISESDKAEMEEYIENIKLLVNTLGHKVFEQKRELKIKIRQDVFFIKAARGADAQGEPTSEGFVVLKGSKATNTTVPSITPSFNKLRRQLIEKNIIRVNIDVLEFCEDYIFTSPSLAAAIVMGRNANGLEEWKLKNGQTLRGYETNITQIN